MVLSLRPRSTHAVISLFRQIRWLKSHKFLWRCGWKTRRTTCCYPTNHRLVFNATREAFGTPDVAVPPLWSTKPTVGAKQICLAPGDLKQQSSPMPVGRFCNRRRPGRAEVWPQDTPVSRQTRGYFVSDCIVSDHASCWFQHALKDGKSKTGFVSTAYASFWPDCSGSSNRRMFDFLGVKLTRSTVQKVPVWLSADFSRDTCAAFLDLQTIVSYCWTDFCHLLAVPWRNKPPAPFYSLICRPI